MKVFFIFVMLGSSLGMGNEVQQQIDAKRAKGSKNMSEQKKKVRAEFKRATSELKASGIEKKVLGKGMKLPNFTVGGKNISDLYKKSPVIIKFYRGHWCPYCMIELKEYEKRYAYIKKNGGQLIGLVPDTTKVIAKTKRDQSLSFPIYQDSENKIAKMLGLAFGLDPKVAILYKGFGIDLAASQGNQNNELPMPGTYLIDKKGMIVHAFFDADYIKRADPDEFIKELKKLSK